jgi:DNA-directed RNA polymerase specialized sigma subunit
MKPKATNPVKAPAESVDPYDVWQRQPTTGNLHQVLASVNPTINSAMTTYAGGHVSPLVRGRAKTMALGAIKSYDPARGASLQTHIMNQLRPLTRYVNRATRPMGLPERRVRQLYSLEQAEKDFYERHGRDPTDDELADRLGLSIRRVGRIRTYASPMIGAESFGEDAVDPTISRPDPMEVWIDYVHHDLGPIDRKILDWKMGRGGQSALRNVEIARRLNISPAAITQRVARIQAKLMEGMEEAA